MRDRFFVDNGDGTEYYATEAEARKAADDWIAEYQTIPEWDEAVDRVCWGEVREYARGYQNAEYISYKLAPVVKARGNRPLDEIHDIALGFGRLLLPWRNGCWLMWSRRKRTFGVTHCQGFHNCSATGVK